MRKKRGLTEAEIKNMLDGVTEDQATRILRSSLRSVAKETHVPAVA